MSYKLGYVADRVGVPSKALQKEKLLEYGVTDIDVYENLDDCLASLREDDRLCVYTTAILGRNKLDDTFLIVSKSNGVGVYSIKTQHLYRCDDSHGIEVLAAARKELEQVTKQQIGAVGRQLGGRKQSGVWKHQEAIRKARNSGVTWKELSEVYDASEATIRRIFK